MRIRRMMTKAIREIMKNVSQKFANSVYALRSVVKPEKNKKMCKWVRVVR